MLLIVQALHVYALVYIWFKHILYQKHTENGLSKANVTKFFPKTIYLDRDSPIGLYIFDIYNTQFTLYGVRTLRIVLNSHSGLITQ